MLDAGVALRGGDARRARARLAEAARRADAEQLAMCAAAARFFLGEPGAEGALADQGAKEPAKIAMLLLPGAR
jgi:uncharacterized protein YgbK (DUF1537 family)